MGEKNKFTFEDFCKVIQAFTPCMNDYLYVLDIPNDQYFISPSALDRFTIPSCRFSDVNNVFAQFVHPKDYDGLLEDLDEVARGDKDFHNLTYRWMGKDGHPVWINCRGRGIAGESGKPQFLIGCINEVGNRPIADDISGLLTSVVLKDSLSGVFAGNPDGFVMCLGIDDFKVISERVGLAYGDTILRGFAECIATSLEQGQQVYRVMSDEFMVLDSSGGTAEDARRLYHKIRNKADKWIVDQNYEIVYTISGGLIMGKDIGDKDYDSVMKIAQFSLSQAMDYGKNQLYCFDPVDYEMFLRQRKILREMRKAISNRYEGFEVYFQPIMKSESEELYAAESLLRFQTENGERISPAEFIPLLENSGLIIPVGNWVLEQALDMCVECQKTLPEFKVSVNLSYVQIMKSDICKVVMNAVERHNLKPESLIVELTESGHLEVSASVRKVWERFRDYGIMIAIDDFGTGYSNLSSIGMMLPNIVKLDRGFTVKAMENVYERQLMDHVIQLVHSIDLKICVEGVETSTELDTVEKLNADCIQGFYYGRPCSREQFLKNFISKEMQIIL